PVHGRDRARVVAPACAPSPGEAGQGQGCGRRGISRPVWILWCPPTVTTRPSTRTRLRNPRVFRRILQPRSGRAASAEVLAADLAGRALVAAGVLLEKLVVTVEEGLRVLETALDRAGPLIHVLWQRLVLERLPFLLGADRVELTAGVRDRLARPLDRRDGVVRHDPVQDLLADLGDDVL